MVPRAETSLPKTDTKPTPLVRVRGKAGYPRAAGAPLKPRGEANRIIRLHCTLLPLGRLLYSPSGTGAPGALTPAAVVAT